MLTCDEDAEFVVIQHLVGHVHHNRLVTIKKAAEEVILEPQIKAPKETTIGHESRYRYVRTHDKDAEGRTIFRLGPAVV